jgi:hypothetical protein
MKVSVFNPSMIKKASLIILTVTIFNCVKPAEPIKITPEHFHQSVDKVVEIMIHDIFSPPVASRIFVYPNIAAYEILAQKSTKYSSVSDKLNGFVPIPKADTNKEINLDLAALMAHMELSKSLIFSEERFKTLQDSLYMNWENKNLCHERC